MRRAMKWGIVSSCLIFMGCGGPPGKVETLARLPGVMCVARAGEDLWIGTGEGLARLAGGRGPAVAYGEGAGLTGGLKQVRWIHPRGGELLCATAAGIAAFSIKDLKLTRSWTSRAGLGAESTRWVGESAGRVWAGTIFGASRLGADGRTWKTYKTAQGLQKDHVYRMIDGGGALWASCMDGGLARYDAASDRFTAVAPERGLGNRHIYAMAAEAGTGLWLGTAGGVNLRRTDPSGWDEKICADGFTEYSVYAVLPAGGTVWFGTAFGLSRRHLDTGVQDHWTTDDGLPHSEVVGLLPDADGVIVATKAGVVRVRVPK